jgi:hypothetical protein
MTNPRPGLVGESRPPAARVTIRFGLEGGGLSKEEARRLTREFVEDRPLTESVATAQGVLMHALYGEAEETAPGEATAAAGM